MEEERTFRNTYAKILGFINSHLFSCRTSEALSWAVPMVHSLNLKSKICVVKDVERLGVHTLIGQVSFRAVTFTFQTTLAPI